MQQLQLMIVLSLLTLCTWGWILYRRFTGQRVLPLRPPSEPAAWGPVHVLLTFLSVLVFQVVAHAVMLNVGDIPSTDSPVTVEKAQLHMALSSAGILAAFFSLWLITRTTTTRAGDLGIGIGPFLPGVTMGLLCFLSFATPSYVLNELLSLLDPRIHPVLDELRKFKDMQFFSYSCITVVFLSPLYEEIICRLILQGWLQSVFARQRAQSKTDLKGASPGGELSSSEEIDGKATSPGRAPGRPTCWRSILLSSLFFAVLHFDAGLGSVGSLFLFAVGLGLIYQHSGRLLPCVVMHMALNATTMLALYLEIRA
jgi:membrane protease YdiL (CAAX protease family)